MSWPWIVLLALALALVVWAEWSRIERLIGVDARNSRERKKRKSKLRVVTTESESDDFVRSVQADLEALPTIEERETPR